MYWFMKWKYRHEQPRRSAGCYVRKPHVIPVRTGNDKRRGGGGRSFSSRQRTDQHLPNTHLSLVITLSNDDNGEDPDSDEDKQAKRSS